MPYYENLNILFIHIPKTGGSSIEKYFIEKNLKKKYKLLNMMSNLYSFDNDNKLPKLTLNGHTLQHSLYIELLYDNDGNINNYFINHNEISKIKIITITRNPYHRIISDMFYLKLIKKNSSKDYVFKKIIYYLYGEDFYDNHRTPQYIYLIDFDNNINKNIIIMRNETLDEDMKKNGFIDFNYKLNISHYNEFDYIDMLNNNSIELINNYYSKDFELFGYNKIISK